MGLECLGPRPGIFNPLDFSMLFYGSRTEQEKEVTDQRLDQEESALHLHVHLLDR